MFVYARFCVTVVYFFLLLLSFMLVFLSYSSVDMFDPLWTAKPQLWLGLCPVITCQPTD